MEEKYRRKAKEFIEKIAKSLEGLEIIGKSQEVLKILDLSRRYLEDAGYFLEKNMLYECYEAIGIAWAYLDALLNLGHVKLKDKSLLEFFTLEGEEWETQHT